MEETIKRKEVIAYKCMEFNMTCKGFHYEVGKSYKIDKAELCKCGFHACLNPRYVLEYYSKDECSRYFKVLLSGEITKCDKFDTEVAATEMTILEEINIDEIIETTEWWKNDNVIDLLYFSDGLARIQRRNNEWNFINTKGKIISEQWFNWVGTFQDGFARVQRTNDEWNFIDTKGNILSKEWFTFVYPFYDGFASVQRTNGECCKIDKTGKLIKILQ